MRSMGKKRRRVRRDVMTMSRSRLARANCWRKLGNTSQRPDMRRRDFLTGLAVIANGIASARMSNAQAPRKMVRVGIATLQPRTGPLWTAFEQRLQQLGYTEGENLAVESIDLNGSISRESEAMKELIRRKVDILIGSGTEIALKSALAATDKLPIVMIAIDYDPLALNYIASLARPGGNVTGVFSSKSSLRSSGFKS